GNDARRRRSGSGTAACRARAWLRRLRSGRLCCRRSAAALWRGSLRSRPGSAGSWERKGRRVTKPLANLPGWSVLISPTGLFLIGPLALHGFVEGIGSASVRRSKSSPGEKCDDRSLLLADAQRLEDLHHARGVQPALQADP